MPTELVAGLPWLRASEVHVAAPLLEKRSRGACLCPRTWLPPASCIPLECRLAGVAVPGIPPHRLWRSSLQLQQCLRGKSARRLAWRAEVHVQQPRFTLQVHVGTAGARNPCPCYRKPPEQWKLFSQIPTKPQALTKYSGKKGRTRERGSPGF